MYNPYGKRIFDVVMSLFALFFLWPIMAITAVLVKKKLGSPIIFKQDRPGKNGDIFTLYKFRTMTDQKDNQGNLLSDAKRLPRFGQLLRSTSLDELPELINIIKGDMSLVGPRPLISRYMPYYTQKEAMRHNVRPGITGLAQINGRNILKWDDRLAMDVEYVNKVSFILDIKIIIKTVAKVIKRDDVVVREDNHMLDLDEERSKNETSKTFINR